MRRSPNLGKVEGRNRAPTATYRFHVNINNNISLINAKQINIAPTLDVFQQAVKQAPNYQLYQVTNVSYKFLALDNVSYQQGASTLELPYYYKVNIDNGKIPLPAESAYLKFQNLQYAAFDKPITGSFTPQSYLSSITERAAMQYSPRLPTDDLTFPLFGHSLLFIKKSATLTNVSLVGVITVTVNFYRYDGDVNVPGVDSINYLRDHNSQLYGLSKKTQLTKQGKDDVQEQSSEQKVQIICQQSQIQQLQSKLKILKNGIETKGQQQTFLSLTPLATTRSQNLFGMSSPRLVKGKVSPTTEFSKI